MRAALGSPYALVWQDAWKLSRTVVMRPENTPVALLGNVFAIPHASSVVLAGTGLALGKLFSIAKKKEQIQELRRKNQSSLLVDLKKDFRSYTKKRGGGDMNFHAWNCMEEYIVD